MTTLGCARGRRLWMLVAAVGGVGLACGAACGPGIFHGIGGGGGDAGSDSGAAACYDPLPEKPRIGESTKAIDLLFAVEDLRIDMGDRPSKLPPATGLDLDRTCTCPGPPSCVAADSDAGACDGERGRDNALGRLFDQLGPVASSDFGEYIRQGGFTALIDIQNWNGEDDDSSVVVALRMSQGLEANVVDGGLGASSPRFDGTDVWSVDPASLINGDRNLGARCDDPGPTTCVPTYFDAKAYVANKQVVAHIDAPIAVSIPSGRLVIDLTGSTLLATIIKVGDSYRLEGQFVGRNPADRLLPNIAALRDPTTGKSICGTGVYDLVKAQICAALDIAKDPAQDGRGAPCDSLSGALRFAASPAKAGLVFKTDDARNDCPGFTDSCAR